MLVHNRARFKSQQTGFVICALTIILDDAICPADMSS